MSPINALSLAALPALLGSGWLLHLAGAGSALWAQQLSVAMVALLVVQAYRRWRQPQPAGRFTPWLLLVLAMLVCWPLLAGRGAQAPHRWLGLMGFRLYIAPVVVPAFLVLAAQALAADGVKRGFVYGAVALLALGLSAQPDAAQLTAFAMGMAAVLVHVRVGRWVWAGFLVLMGLALVWGWQAPDPLVPVPYVEGVFALARQHSLATLALAVLAAALPCATLVWLARQHRHAGLLGAACYIAVLLGLAPLQITPVPLLGFGAGPVLGYGLMLGVLAWRRPAP